MWKKEDLLTVLLMEKLQYMFTSFMWLLWYLVRHKHEIHSNCLHRSHTQLPGTRQSSHETQIHSNLGFVSSSSLTTSS